MGILTAICELGVSDLRTVPGLGGACFTLGTAAIKALAYLLYNYDSMVDTGRKDLVVTGLPLLELADRTKGYAVGNSLNVNLPVTTTIVHKDPDVTQGFMIVLYLYLFSQENLRSSTFKYSLSRPNKVDITAERDEMPNSWQNLRTASITRIDPITPMFLTHHPLVSSRL
jgi:hypothetical protein